MKNLTVMMLPVLMLACSGQAKENLRTPPHGRKGDLIQAHPAPQPESGRAAAVQAKLDRAVKRPELVRRLESRLIDAAEHAAVKGVKQSAAALKASGTAMRGDNVVVIVQCTETADLKAVADLIAAKNGIVLRTGEAHVKAAVPVTALEDIASTVPGVAFVRTPVEKRLYNSVVSEGCSITAANPWHTAGYTGQGVKVAVIDGGFAGLAELKAQNEIPASAIEMDFTGTGMTSGTENHGCACAEIIYDMAPGCQLYLLKTIDSSDDEAAKNYCKAQGIQIISFSGGYDGINFYDGVANSAFVPHPVAIANDADANGILWVTAAGNEQVNHSMIKWRDDNADGYLDWAADFSYVPLWNGGDVIPAGTEIMAALTWNKWPATDQDFDLILRYWNGSGWTTLASSEDLQNGTQPPFEGVIYTVPAEGTTADNYGLFIYKYSATASPTFILRTFPFGPSFYSYDNYMTPAAGSITCPADAAASFAVGAIESTNYAGGPLEYYSSLGPNNGAYTGNPEVVKPDICGPDGVSTVTYGARDFFGTSASVPHIAGLAALVKSAYPAYTGAQLKTYIQNHGVDLGTAGKDNTYGFGPCVLPVPQHTVIVSTPYGKAAPAAGTNWYNRASFVTAALTNSPVIKGTATQYVCTGWSGTGSVPADGTGTNTGPFELTANSSITWLWTTNYWLDTVTNGNGTVSPSDQWCAFGSNVVLTASPAVSNRFTGWTGQTNGCTISSNQITAVMNVPRQITAGFIRQYNLLVSTPCGDGNPSAGISRFDSGSSVTARMSGSPVTAGTTQYVCRGWSGTGNVPASGTVTNAGPFTITADSSISWLWRTNFWLDTVSPINGSLNTGDCWLASGSNIQITATASNYWHFTAWAGDTNGCTIAGNKITVLMNSPRTIQAVFSPNQYSLTVSNGLGSGSYTNGEVVPVTANTLVGKTFNRWTGATQYLAGITSSVTTLTMPASNITVTAAYTDIQYTLTVTGGSGSGTGYTNQQQVSIAAGSAPYGKLFDQWSGAVECVADIFSPNTVVTMPASNITVAAAYKDAYLLSVDSGSGGGWYTNRQQVVITANASSGKTFVCWIGDTQYISNVTSSTATVTMPAEAVVLTATYQDVFSVTPEFHFFGTVAPGAVAERTFVVRNHGTNSLACTVSVPDPYSVIAEGRDYRSLALSASASSTLARWPWPPSAVIYGAEGEWSSQYRTGANNTEWISLDLGQPVALGGIRIGPRFVNNSAVCFPSDYRFEYSTNGTAWISVPGASYAGQANPSGSVTHMFAAAVQTRYVRLVATKLRTDPYNNYYFQLSELEPLPPALTVAAYSNQSVIVRCRPVAGLSFAQTVAFAGGGLTVLRAVNAELDTDADGIPDVWELTHYGSTTNANPADVCSNGFNTVRQAYIAGLNPNDPQSILRVAVLCPPGSEVLRWNAASGRVYSVHWTSNLLSGFQCMESNIPWTRNSFSNSAAVPCGYYKVDVRLE